MERGGKRCCRDGRRVADASMTQLIRLGSRHRHLPPYAGDRSLDYQRLGRTAIRRRRKEEGGAKSSSWRGVSSDVCLTFPALGATHDGYDVYAVMDASGTFNQHALMASMFRMSQAGVKIANAIMVVSEMLANWSGKYAAPVGRISGARVPNFGFLAVNLAHRAQQARK
jgi:hypothetical protein